MTRIDDDRTSSQWLPPTFSSDEPMDVLAAPTRSCRAACRFAQPPARCVHWQGRRSSPLRQPSCSAIAPPAFSGSSDKPSMSAGAVTIRLNRPASAQAKSHPQPGVLPLLRSFDLRDSKDPAFQVPQVKTSVKGTWCIVSNTWCPLLTDVMISSGSLVKRKGRGSPLVSARNRLMAAWSSTIERKTPRFKRRFVSLAK